MKYQTLLDNFNGALTWNAILFGAQRIGTAVLTTVLFAKTNATTFGLWASLNSIIYLIVLWTDCGFRKSIARYMPYFTQHHVPSHYWLRPAIKLQTIAIAIATPILIFATHRTINAFDISANHHWYYIACLLLFATQAYMNCARLILHAQFKNKWINSRIIAITGLELIASCIAAYLSSSIVLHLIAIKIIGGVITSIICMCELRQSTQSTQVAQEYDIKPFIKHSFVMWITTLLKSLSERNAITLITMYVYGPAYANGIKIAQEGSLLLYRTIIKTIGTADTAFLAHINSDKKEKIGIDDAVTKLTTKIVGLCVPLLGLVAFCFFQKISFIYDTYVFHMFIIMSISYLIETMLIGYERIIEVKHDYNYLTIAYSVYSILLILVYLGLYIMKSSIGSLMLITLIQSVRLVSIYIMFFLTRSKYNVRFPIRHTIQYALISLAFIISAYTLSINVSSSSLVLSWVTYISYSLLS